MSLKQLLFLWIGLAIMPGCYAQFSRSVTTTEIHQSPEPLAPEACLFRPEFQTTIGTAQAGTAFPVKFDGNGPTVLLSALHLLGPSSGLPEVIPPDRVHDFVKGIRLFELFDNKRSIDTKPVALTLDDTAPLQQPSKHGDVVAFLLPNGIAVNPLELASKLPEVDEPVWLAGQLVGGAPATQKLHRGKFVGVNRSGHFLVAFDNPKIELRATSGAPVLNSKSQVVAINLGGGISGGIVYGSGNPVTRFEAAVKAALQRHQSATPESANQ